jgi:hypothetical protein
MPVDEEGASRPATAIINNITPRENFLSVSSSPFSLARLPIMRYEDDIPPISGLTIKSRPNMSDTRSRSSAPPLASPSHPLPPLPPPSPPLPELPGSSVSDTSSDLERRAAGGVGLQGTPWISLSRFSESTNTVATTRKSGNGITSHSLYARSAYSPSASTTFDMPLPSPRSPLGGLAPMPPMPLSHIPPARVASMGTLPPGEWQLSPRPLQSNPPAYI